MTPQEKAQRTRDAKEWLENKAYCAAHEDALRELIDEWLQCTDKDRRDDIWREVNCEMTRYSRIENFSKEEVDRSK